MAEKDKYAGEMLSDEELDNVAGGTLHEYAYLTDILPATYSLTGRMTPEEAEKWLKDNLNIDAIINNKDQNTPNVYKRDGKTLDHWDVVRECYAFLGK